MSTTVAAQVAKFHHVALSVRDLEESVEWYEKFFGMKVLSRMVIPYSGAQMAFIGNGEFVIELLYVEKHKPLPEGRSFPDTDNETLGVKHFCVSVPDNRSFIQMLKDNGVKIALEMQSPPMPRYGAHVLDPTGNLIEIFQDDFDVSSI